MKMGIVLWMCGLLLVSAAAGQFFESEEETTRANTCSCGWTNKGRIVNGKTTQKNEYPLMVGIRKKLTKSMFCGATIITEWHVITAAHCTARYKANDIQLVLGEHDTTSSDAEKTIIDVEKIVDHEEYTSKPIQHDLSLLVTKKRIPFNKNIGPACMPTRKMYLVKEFLKVLGWGYTSNFGGVSSTLQEVDLPVIPFRQCQGKWPNAKEETMLCTYQIDKDSCKGDSGGPLIWLDPRSHRYALVAVVSYGGKCASDKPGVNTDVTAYVKWINDKVEETKPGTKTCSSI